MSEKIICPQCGKEPETRWVLIEHEMNRVPRWQRRTLCCGRYVGDVEAGYSSPDGRGRVSPQFGL